MTYRTITTQRRVIHDGKTLDDEREGHCGLAR